LCRRLASRRFILGTHGGVEQNENTQQNHETPNHDHLRPLPTLRQWFLSQSHLSQMSEEVRLLIS
jgi:hypothetical protein